MEDTFTIQIPNSSHVPATKRQLLQYVASIYGPLGCNGPILLPLKIHPSAELMATECQMV